jgi:hypothetical protein
VLFILDLQYVSTVQSPQDGLHGVQAVSTNARDCTVLYGTAKNFCLSSIVCTVRTYVYCR